MTENYVVLGDTLLVCTTCGAIIPRAVTTSPDSDATWRIRHDQWHERLAHLAP